MYTPLVGKDIQGLRVVGLLGRGGMGEVYKAFDARLQRTVAIKVVSELYALDKDFSARFAREARSASAVNHPNVAQIFSSGEIDQRPYYVMEYVEGRSLADLLGESGHLGGRRSLEFLLQAAEGLRAAAEAGIVHRDIKPANMMVDAKGRLKIVDFGLARRLAEDVRVTRSDHVLGTPTYLSPEQAQGQEVDQRSDIYSLGASFYHLLSGTPPFEGDTPVAVILKHVGDPLPPLREKNPRVPAAVAAIIERMMAKDPRDRYPGYDPLIADLEAALHARPSTAIGGEGQRTVIATVAPTAAEGRSWVVPAIAVVAVGVGLIVFFGRRGAPPIVSTASQPERHGPAVPPDSGSDIDSPQEAIRRIAAGERLDPDVMYKLAYQTETLARLRSLSVALEVEQSRLDKLPESLQALVESAGVHPQTLQDGWGRPIRYIAGTDHTYQLTSAGADGLFETRDDIQIENGEVTKGGPPRGAAPDLPAMPPPT